MTCDDSAQEPLRTAYDARTLQLHEARGALAEAVAALRTELAARRAELAFAREDLVRAQTKVESLERQLAAAAKERAALAESRDIAVTEAERLTGLRRAQAAEPFAPAPNARRAAGLARAVSRLRPRS